MSPHFWAVLAAAKVIGLHAAQMPSCAYTYTHTHTSIFTLYMRVSLLQAPDSSDRNRHTHTHTHTHTQTHTESSHSWRFFFGSFKLLEKVPGFMLRNHPLYVRYLGQQVSMYAFMHVCMCFMLHSSPVVLYIHVRCMYIHTCEAYLYTYMWDICILYIHVTCM
jgi:hypothetical protein